MTVHCNATAIVAAVGGGGLVAGLGSALKAIKPEIRAQAARNSGKSISQASSDRL